MAKPSGPRIVRVVVVVVVMGGGEQFDDQLLDLLLFCPPIQNFLPGGIRAAWTRFLCGVGAIHGLQSIFLFDPLLRKVATIYQKIMYSAQTIFFFLLFSLNW